MHLPDDFDKHPFGCQIFTELQVLTGVRNARAPGGVRIWKGEMGAGLMMVGNPATVRSWGLLTGRVGMSSRGSTPDRLALPAAKVPPACMHIMQCSHLMV